MQTPIESSYPVSSDRRYTVTRETHNGAPQYVVRFGRETVGQSLFYASAAMLAVGHNARRQGALVVTEQR